MKFVANFCAKFQKFEFSSETFLVFFWKFFFVDVNFEKRCLENYNPFFQEISRVWPSWVLEVMIGWYTEQITFSAEGKQPAFMYKI